jgi:ketosteroid isomerase-like protein
MISSEIVLNAIRAIEERDQRAFLSLMHPDFEIHWPESLPYGGVTRGPEPEKITWTGTWAPLQPTEVERRMDPQVLAATDENVVVLWRQRGVTPHGIRFDGEVLGRYKIRDGKLFRAKMYYFDTAAVASFLAESSAKMK